MPSGSFTAMRRVFVSVALGLAVLFGFAVAFVAAFTVIGEMGLVLAIVAAVALFRRCRPARPKW
jgi:hypothetical protein